MPLLWSMLCNCHATLVKLVMASVCYIIEENLMRTRYLLFLLATAGLAPAAAPDGWPHWRGPNDDGMARGEAPLRWSDKEHVAWKTPVPGKGHSSPVIWGDRIFLTT